MFQQTGKWRPFGPKTQISLHRTRFQRSTGRNTAISVGFRYRVYCSILYLQTYVRRADVPGHIERADQLTIDVALDFAGPAPAAVEMRQQNVVPAARLQFKFYAQLVPLAGSGLERGQHETVAHKMGTVAETFAGAESSR